MLTIHTSDQVTSTDDNEEIQDSSKYSELGFGGGKSNRFFSMAEPNLAFD